MKIIICVLSLLSALITLKAQDNKDLKEVVFNTSWYPQAQFAGYFVAAQKGFYEKYGIKTKFIFSDFETTVDENLTDGKADLGIMWLHEGILAHNKNKNLINIAQLMDSSNILIVARSKNIRSIGIWKPYVKFLETYIHKELSDTIEVVPLRDGNEAFIQGAVDAVTVMEYNELNKLIENGIDRKDLYIYKLSDLGLLLPEDGMYCRRSFYEQNQKLCEDFIKASLEGWRYAFQNIDEAVEICFKFIKGSNYYTNVSIQKLMLNSIKNIVGINKLDKDDLQLNKESFERAVKFLIRNGLINSEIQYEQFSKGSQ